MTDTLSAQALPTSASSGVPVTAPVTAVVVTAGLTRYLPVTLAALAAQTRRPVRVLVVDVGGPDGVPQLLDETFAAAPPGPTPRLTRTAAAGVATFGKAVTAGLATMDLALGEPATPWVWLLHDDSAPAPDALAELVRAVGRAPSVALAGSKQRTWTDPERLLEVGVRTTPWGRRMTDVEPGELDQGQLDGRTDVLAVGLAGALVRRDVWDALRGPDPALGEFGAGLDVSRRARLAGHRVVVVPSAVVRHAQARYYGLRGRSGPEVDADGDGEVDSADPLRSLARRRRAVVHDRLVAAPLPLLPVVAAVAVLATLVRALGELAYNQPAAAADEVRGGFGALTRPTALWRARRRAAATRRLPRRALWALQATWRDVWMQAQDRRLARLEARKVQRAPSELEIGELAAVAARRRWTLGALAGVLLAASAIGFGPLLGPVVGDGARLVGGALAAATTSWGDVWASATSGWVRDGLGVAGPADPLLLVLAVPAVLLGGHVAAAVALFMLGSVLLAGLGAWAAAGAATRSAGVRAWAAVVWAAAPPLLLAVGSGRLGAVVAHVALPWVALGIARACGVHRVDQVVSGVVTAVASDEHALVLTRDERDAAWVDGDGAGRVRRVRGRARHASPEAPASPDETVELPVGASDESAADDALPAPDSGEAALDRVSDDQPRADDEDALHPPIRVAVSAADGQHSPTGPRAVATADDIPPAPAAHAPAGVVPTQRPAATPAGGVPRLVGAPDPTGSITAAAGAALALALAVAGAPVLLAPALLAILVVVATVPRRRWRLLLVPVPALAVLAPFLIEAGHRGKAGLRLLVAEPGLPVAATPAPPWQRLLGLPVDGGSLVPAGLTGRVAEVWPLALGGTVLALALLALLRGRAVARGVRVAWLVAAFGLLTASVVAIVPVVVAGGTVGPAWTGAPLSVALLGLLAAAVLGTAGLRERLARWSFGWHQVASVVVVVVAAAIAVGTLASWAWTAPTASGLHPLGRLVVPAVAQEVQQGPDASRVLALSDDAGGASWTLLRADGTQLVDSSSAARTRVLSGGLRTPRVAAPDAGTSEVVSLAADLVHGASADVSGRLAGLAVASVLVPPATQGDAAAAASRALLVGRLDSTPGLARVTENATGTLWRVSPAPRDDGTPGADVVSAWARLLPAGTDPTDPTKHATAVTSDGRGVDAQIGAGAAGSPRALVLADRADPAWHATLDGRSLRAVAGGWRQTFEVPTTGGHLVVWYEPPMRSGWLWLVGIVGAFTAILAIPLRRRRVARP
jgi:GT2 family glycosyltransferase